MHYKTLTSIPILPHHINYESLLKYIAIPLIIGIIAAFITRDSMATFDTFDKPALSPPGWLFPVVWTIFYILMGISAYLISVSPAAPLDKAKALAVYTYQLAVNFLWSIFSLVLVGIYSHSRGLFYYGFLFYL